MLEAVYLAMKRKSLDSYLRTHRRKAGLSQREMGMLLGYEDESAVARHEKSKALPPLLIAIGYEVVFKVPIAKLFSGLKETVEKTVEVRILQFEENLQQKNEKGGRASHIAQKLAWLSERRNMNDT